MSSVSPSSPCSPCSPGTAPASVQGNLMVMVERFIEASNALVLAPTQAALDFISQIPNIVEDIPSFVLAVYTAERTSTNACVQASNIITQLLRSRIRGLYSVKSLLTFANYVYNIYTQQPPASILLMQAIGHMLAKIWASAAPYRDTLTKVLEDVVKGVGESLAQGSTPSNLPQPILDKLIAQLYLSVELCIELGSVVSHPRSGMNFALRTLSTSASIIRAFDLGNSPLPQSLKLQEVLKYSVKAAVNALMFPYKTTSNRKSDRKVFLLPMTAETDGLTASATSILGLCVTSPQTVLVPELLDISQELLFIMGGVEIHRTVGAQNQSLLFPGGSGGNDRRIEEEEGELQLEIASQIQKRLDGEAKTLYHCCAGLIVNVANYITSNQLRDQIFIGKVVNVLRGLSGDLERAAMFRSTRIGAVFLEDINRRMSADSGSSLPQSQPSVSLLDDSITAMFRLFQMANSLASFSFLLPDIKAALEHLLCAFTCILEFVDGEEINNRLGFPSSSSSSGQPSGILNPAMAAGAGVTGALTQGALRSVTQICYRVYNSFIRYAHVWEEDEDDYLAYGAGSTSQNITNSRIEDTLLGKSSAITEYVAHIGRRAAGDVLRDIQGELTGIILKLLGSDGTGGGIGMGMMDEVNERLVWFLDVFTGMITNGSRELDREEEPTEREKTLVITNIDSITQILLAIITLCLVGIGKGGANTTFQLPNKANIPDFYISNITCCSLMEALITLFSDIYMWRFLYNSGAPLLSKMFVGLMTGNETIFCFSRSVFSVAAPNNVWQPRPEDFPAFLISLLSSLAYCGDYAGDRKVTVELIEGIRSIVVSGRVANEYSTTSARSCGDVDTMLGNRHCTEILDSWLLTGTDAAAMVNPVTHFTQKHRRALASLVMDIVVIPGVTGANSDVASGMYGYNGSSHMSVDIRPSIRTFSEARVNEFIMLSARVAKALTFYAANNNETTTRANSDVPLIQLLSVYVNSLYGALMSHSNSSLLFQTLTLSDSASTTPFGLLARIVRCLLAVCSASTMLQSSAKAINPCSPAALTFDGVAESLLTDSLSFMTESCRTLTLFISTEKTSVLFDTLAAFITEYCNGMEPVARVLGNQGMAKHVTVLMEAVSVLINMNNVSGSSNSNILSIARSTFTILRRFMILLESNNTNQNLSPGSAHQSGLLSNRNSATVNAFNAATAALCAILDNCGMRIRGPTTLASCLGQLQGSKDSGGVLEMSHDDVHLIFTAIRAGMNLVSTGCNSTDDNSNSHGCNDTLTRQTADLLGKLLTSAFATGELNTSNLLAFNTHSTQPLWATGGGGGIVEVVGLFISTLFNGICINDNILIGGAAEALSDIYMVALERTAAGNTEEEIPIGMLVNTLEVVYPFLFRAAVLCVNEGFCISDSMLSRAGAEMERLYMAVGNRIVVGLKDMLDGVVRERMELNGGTVGAISRSFSRKFALALRELLVAIPKLIVEVL